MASRKKIANWLAKLKDEDASVRREAARRLGHVGNLDAVTALIGALQDEDWRVRSSVASALGLLGDTQAVSPLIEALEDKTATVRRTAAYALGRLRDSEAIEALCAALGDKKRSVRENAMFALQQVGVGAVSTLCQRLADENIRLRVHATLTLSHLYQQSGREALDRILSDRHLMPQQRWQGLEAIRAARPSRFAFGWLKDVYRHCEATIQFSKTYGDADSAASRGAQQVMEYMSLARPAQRDFASERSMLLRAAQDDPEEDSGETLLRGSSVEETTLPTGDRPLFFRLIHWFGTLLRRV